MVPNGWERKPIKELCESIIDCVNKTAKHVDYVTPYKMIRTTNVRNGRVDTNNVRYVEKDTYTQWIRRGAPQNGDIIFTREAPVGEAGILENAQGIFLGQRTMMYRAHPDKSDNKYIFYSLMSGYCQKQIEDFSNGGTVAHMRVPDCGELIINTPPLPEQRKIAKILSTWDRGIATTEKLIETSKQQKKALMQQLLTGKKRLVDGSSFRKVREGFAVSKLVSFLTIGMLS
jgi:type I restriction enzyme S subunit